MGKHVTEKERPDSPPDGLRLPPALSAEPASPGSPSAAPPHPPAPAEAESASPSGSRSPTSPPPTPKAQLDREFSELYRAHLRDVYSYAYYRVGNHHDAEDLTEQTFLQAYRHFERALRESRGRPLRPWLIRIAHNLAANLYRDRSRRPASPLEDTAVVSAPHTTEDLVEDREELSRVLAGVRQLPSDRREALIMRFALGMDNREIARALGRSDGATKVLLHRAIRQLEGLVAEGADEREGRRAAGGRQATPATREAQPPPGGHDE